MHQPAAVVRSALLGLSVALAAAGCGGALPSPPPSATVAPDLVPVPLTGVEGYVAFCDLEDGELRVTVRNVGSEDAPASTTTVAFDYSSRITPISTPATAAGRSTAVNVELPQPLPATEYDFTITVDSLGEVDEVSETNNYGEGQCPPP